jgi:hypothetical protein
VCSFDRSFVLFCRFAASVCAFAASAAALPLNTALRLSITYAGTMGATGSLSASASGGTSSVFARQSALALRDARFSLADGACSHATSLVKVCLLKADADASAHRRSSCGRRPRHLPLAAPRERFDQVSCLAFGSVVFLHQRLLWVCGSCSEPIALSPLMRYASIAAHPALRGSVQGTQWRPISSRSSRATLSPASTTSVRVLRLVECFARQLHADHFDLSGLVCAGV